MDLALGSHAVTLLSVLDTQTINVNGIILSALSTPVDEVAGFSPDGTDTQDATSLAALINAIFDDSTGISATSVSNVVTITGAYKVTSSDSTFTISSTSYSDEPPFVSDFDQWALDGELDLLGKLADDVLVAGDSGDLVTTLEIAGTATATFQAPAGLLRTMAIEARLGGDTKNYRCTKVSPGEMLQIRSGTHAIYKVNTGDGEMKYYSVYNDGSAAPYKPIQFSEDVVDSSTINIVAIQQPQQVKSAASDLPDHLHALVVDYMVIIAWQQRGQANVAGTLYQKYIADIMAINAVYQTR